MPAAVAAADVLGKSWQQPEALAAATAKSWTVTKVSGALGASVSGIDLEQATEADALIVGDLLVEHGVLFFRDQEMTPEQQKALGRHFGELHFHPAWPRLVEGHPEVMEIYTDENSKHIAGEHWHSDVSCDAEPPLGTILYMTEVPPVGGDTLFANMYAAFGALSEPMQRFLAGLTAIHDGDRHYRGRYEQVDEKGKTYPLSEHPVVRTHPETGRKAVYLGGKILK